MPRHVHLTAAAALCGAIALTGCTETMMAGGTGTDALTVSALQAKGFKTRARTTGGQIIAMSYSGPVTDAVVCGPRGAPKAPISARMTDLDGVKKTATLDAYVILSDGKVVDGIFAIVLRSSGSTLEGIDFAPGESKAFVSGLTCTSA
jgi:hypothetical protein